MIFNYSQDRLPGRIPARRSGPPITIPSLTAVMPAAALLYPPAGTSARRRRPTASCPTRRRSSTATLTPEHVRDDPDAGRAEPADDRDARGPRAALAQADEAVERRDRGHRPGSRLHPAGPVVRPLRHGRADPRLGAGHPDDRHAAGRRPSAAGSAAGRSGRSDASFESRTKKAVVALTSVDDRPLGRVAVHPGHGRRAGRAEPGRPAAVPLRAGPLPDHPADEGRRPRAAGAGPGRGRRGPAEPSSDRGTS